MRIRKHAKISPLVYAVSSLKAGIVLQPHVCQLNQSPWDVISFSPPPSQVNGSGGSAGNGSSGGCITPAERELNASEYPDTMQEDNPPSPPPAACCKTDGKSWQCRREASKGHSLCEHHLSLVKSYSTNSSHHTTKKSAKPAEVEAAPPRRTRPKKAPAASSSNRHEFYYYSGFGPRWGKKRGESSRNNAVDEPEKEIAIAAEEDSDNGEYEDDDEEEEEMGKKRVRKRIKARSLKSLM